MNGRDWAQIALVTVALLFLMLLVILSIGGCVFTRDDALDEGYFTVDADCEKNRVKVELDLDRTDSVKKIQVTK